MLITAVTDALGRTTTSAADVWGQTVRVTPPEGPWTSYVYDPLGQLADVYVQYDGNQVGHTDLAYDMAGRKTA